VVESAASRTQPHPFWPRTSPFFSPPGSVPLPCARSARFLPAPAFAALTVALVAYFGWVLTSDARSKGLASPLGSYPDIFLGKPRVAREWDP
jgi:hypothetical protein